MRHYSTTEARRNFSSIIEQVHYLKVIVSVGRHGESEVLIIPKPEIDTDTDMPISAINANSESFDFLENEPDIYSLNDLKKRYV